MEFLRCARSSLSCPDADEMGVPAYLHPSPAMRWVYWHRLDIALQMVGEAIGVAVDFGCGPGVLLPLLAARSEHTYAIDVRPETARRLVSRFQLNNVDVTRTCSEVPHDRHGVDLIVALDVLEHVHNLDGVLGGFHQMLSASGRLILSGPTENNLYRLGRHLAGFSGDYHRRTIYDVLNVVRQHFTIGRVQRLFALCPFFLIAECGRDSDMALDGERSVGTPPTPATGEPVSQHPHFRR